MTITELKQTAVEVRKGIVTAIRMLRSRGIRADRFRRQKLFTYLYFEEMNIDPKNPINGGS